MPRNYPHDKIWFPWFIATLSEPPKGETQFFVRKDAFIIRPPSLHRDLKIDRSTKQTLGRPMIQVLLSRTLLESSSTFTARQSEVMQAMMRGMMLSRPRRASITGAGVDSRAGLTS